MKYLFNERTDFKYFVKEGLLQEKCTCISETLDSSEFKEFLAHLAQSTLHLNKIKSSFDTFFFSNA